MEPQKISLFLTAHNQVYLQALEEIKSGYKRTHWMWYIFPQIKGLGKSETSRYYALENLKDASDYLMHPVLGKHLIEISEALLSLSGRSAGQILGAPDDLKLCSCITLFARVEGACPVFNRLLEKYFEGQPDELTLKFL